MEEINGFKRTVIGVGYIGCGEHSHKGLNGKTSKMYSAWSGMLKRCYSENYLDQNPTYVGCSVDPQWHDLQNFAEWYKEQYKEDGWCLDKDILMPHNKVYSPDNCCYVPQEVNKAVKLGHTDRTKLPVGVVAQTGACGVKFIAQIHIGRQYGKCLGVFDTPEEAHLVYCYAKEKHIKNLAEVKYSKVLRQDVKVAMINFKVSDRMIL